MISRPVGIERSFLALLALGLACAPLRLEAGGVVINEIYYDPPDGGSRLPGKDFEFVELHNAAAVAVEVSGWSFARGLQYTIPEGTTIPAGGYLVVARRPEILRSRFSIPLARIVGGFESVLDNGGETLELLDERGLGRDRVTFDDRFPWPVDADGAGASLERICPLSSGATVANWMADPIAGPTPGEVNNVLSCPPPRHLSPPVVIHEILYHAAEDQDESEEFIEFKNVTDQAIDLSGWALTDGVEYTFDAGTILEPRGLIVVAADAARLAASRELTNVVGDFTGTLANGGERIEISDADGLPVDALVFSDHGEWPAAPDGLGFSLEKVVAEADGNDPASWRTARAGGASEFSEVTITGAATSSRLYLYLEGPAEALIDDLTLERVSDGQSALSGGDFNVVADADAWSYTGNHGNSRWQSTGGVGNSGCVRLISSGVGASSGNSMNRTTSPALVDGTAYRVRFQYRLLSGNASLVCRLSGSNSSTGLFRRIGIGSRSLSPGEENGAGAAVLPPFVSDVRHAPRQPRSTDRTIVSCRVRGERPVDTVELEYWTAGGKPTTVLLLDDGANGDGLAGDGIHAARLPRFGNDTLVRYRITALDSAGVASTFPPRNEPTSEYAFYVNNDQPDSPLPVYHILGGSINDLGCSTYRTRHFVHDGEVFLDVGVRNRGGSQCGQTKRNLKVRFNRGTYFLGKRKINLNSLWPDKSLLRDRLSWETLRVQNHVYCESYHVRVHHDGNYHGLFLYIENPDKFYLARNGLNDKGNLYKAVASTEQRRNSEADYKRGYEKKTNEDGDFSDLASFITTMHDTPDSQIVDWLNRNVDVEAEIDYQTAVVAINSTDHNHKNHYLYHDTDTGLWMHTLWDLELTFGSYWDGGNGGLYNDEIDPFRVGLFMGEGGNGMTTTFFRARGRSGLRYFDRAYLHRLWAHLREKTNETVTDPRVEVLRDLLIDEQAEDIAKWGRFPTRPSSPRHPPNFNYNVDQILDIGQAAGTGYLRRRMGYLRGQLDSRGIRGFPWVRITEIMYNPAGPSEELEFLEIHNTETGAVDISGWYIGTIDYEFPADTTLEGGATLIIAKNPEAFRERYPGIARVHGPYPGNLGNGGDSIRMTEWRPWTAGSVPLQHPITIDFVRYQQSSPWPADADGDGKSLVLRGGDLSLDNDLGESWEASLALGGNPGTLSNSNQSPLIELEISTLSGLRPLVVDFDASASVDPDGDGFEVEWRFGDGGSATGSTALHSYTDPGIYVGQVILADGISPPVFRDFEILVFQGPSQVLFRRGDVNADGLVDIGDAVRLLLGMFRGAGLSCRRSADADDDGSIEIDDAVVILEYLFRSTGSLPAPFPDCGLDTTADSLECAAHGPCD